MKRYKKIIGVMGMTVICLLAVAAALIFMGVTAFPGSDAAQSTAGEKDNAAQMISPQAGETDSGEAWHIRFKGFRFCVKPVGMAIIHESGCLNIRSCEDYLIQIDVEDKTADEFWSHREEKIKNLESYGYRMEASPEKIEIGGKEYIRYIVSLSGERGADYETSYFCVLISKASEDKRFLTTVRLDGVDVASLNAAEKGELYGKAIEEAAGITGSAEASEEPDDPAGSYWEENSYLSTDGHDSVEKDGTVVSYSLPEGYRLLQDNLAGKSYYSEEDKITVITSVIPYTWLSAADMAKNRNGAGISKIEREGRYERNGTTYYYYAYSVLSVKNETRNYTYYFNAYADLPGGDIYSIHGFADGNPKAMEADTYGDFMDITEE